MNKTRRAELSKLQDRIAALAEAVNNAETLRADIVADLETIRDEEQDAFDNLPQSLQDGERGQDMANAVDNLSTALDTLESLDLSADLDDAVSNIEDARGQA